ncbi:glycosyltransferase family 2 protein, partial [Pseudomonas sp. NBRC 111136]|uniref:glycosyltransferase family 2 protein n=1 Tax=Pseudomonas sp. NBRC 111136 TaxID=1661051 RepID=UPI000A76A226
QQISSILAQVDVSVGLFISIDPSTDSTDLWCKGLAAKHSNVHVLPTAGPFGGAAPNFFRLIRDVELTDFDYVALSDQDDIWFLDKLSRAISQIAISQAEAYSSNVVAFWPDGRKRLIDKAQAQVDWDYLFESAGPGCSYVLSKNMASAFKKFIIQNWERVQAIALHDWLCYAFARANGLKWFIDPRPNMLYRQHSANQVGANTGVLSGFVRFRQVLKGWWSVQVKLIAELTDYVNAEGRPEITGRFSLLRLAMQARLCRRRKRDQLYFAGLCMVMAIFFKGKP